MGGPELFVQGKAHHYGVENQQIHFRIAQTFGGDGP